MTTPEELATAARRISKARVSLVLGHPFFGSLAMRLRVEAHDDIKTMETNGAKLYYNPNFVNSLNHAELQGVMAHEVMHLAVQHHARQGARDHARWNIAGDHAINHILEACGFSLPETRHADPAFIGMTADAIYARIPEQPKGGGGAGGGARGGGRGADYGGTGSFSPPPGASPADLEQSAQEWAVAASQAAATAKAAGKLPGALEDLVRQWQTPRKDWRDLLRRFVTAAAKSDYSWTRPNRRHIHNGFYLPGLHSQRAGMVGVVVDTSGSVSRAELAQFAGELNAICSEVLPERVRVVYCDAAVAAHEDIHPADGEELVFTPRGRGGTDMAPAFRYLFEGEEEAPEVVICFTDLEFFSWPAEPAVPVLWVSTGGTDAPFGDVVQLTV